MHGGTSVYINKTKVHELTMEHAPYRNVTNTHCIFIGMFLIDHSSMMHLYWPSALTIEPAAKYIMIYALEFQRGSRSNLLSTLSSKMF